MSDFRALVAEKKDQVVSDRRYLHRIPETGFNEDVMLLGVETHCRVALELLS